MVGWAVRSLARCFRESFCDAPSPSLSLPKYIPVCVLCACVPCVPVSLHLHPNKQTNQLSPCLSHKFRTTRDPGHSQSLGACPIPRFPAHSATTSDLPSCCSCSSFAFTTIDFSPYSPRFLPRHPNPVTKSFLVPVPVPYHTLHRSSIAFHSVFAHREALRYFSSNSNSIDPDRGWAVSYLHLSDLQIQRKW